MIRVYNDSTGELIGEYDRLSKCTKKTCVYVKMQNSDTCVHNGIRYERVNKLSVVDAEAFLSKATLQPNTSYFYSNTTGRWNPIEGLNISHDRVLVIPDLHIPAEHKGALDFCKRLRDKYGCTKIISIGDIVDFHASSRFPTDPDGLSAGDELGITKLRLQAWYKEFPEMDVLIGNHDKRQIKKAFNSGMSNNWVKGLAEVLEVPNWKFSYEVTLLLGGKNVLFTHGDGLGGSKSAIARRVDKRMSVVQGHLHSCSYIDWSSNDSNTSLFSMQLGCLVDTNHYAMKYASGGKEVVLNAGVIIDGIPTLIPFK